MYKVFSTHINEGVIVLKKADMFIFIASYYEQKNKLYD